MNTTASALLGVELRASAPPILRVQPDADPAGWAAAHRHPLRAAVDEHGSVLVRGLGLRDEQTAAGVLRALGGQLMTEREAFAARRQYEQGVYSSATWPPTQRMCMHHELSFALEPPALLLLACLTAPEKGGETAVANAGDVLDALPGDLVSRFEREGWLLVRSYSEEIGSSVAEAFGTDDRTAVERYCQANAIEAAWQPDGSLRTRQRRAAVVRHPVSGRRCWFNQVAFLSEWTLDPEVREYLVDVYGADGLPFNTRYGGGDPIGEDVVLIVNEAYDARTAAEPWQPGDLMLIDNVATAHSREAFSGPREILLAMSDPVSLSAAGQGDGANR